MLNYLLVNILMPQDVSEPVEHCKLITCVHSRQCWKQAARNTEVRRYLRYPETGLLMSHPDEWRTGNVKRAKYSCVLTECWF